MPLERARQSGSGETGQPAGLLSLEGKKLQPDAFWRLIRSLRAHAGPLDSERTTSPL